MLGNLVRAPTRADHHGPTMLLALWLALAAQAAATPLPASLAPFLALPLPICTGLPFDATIAALKALQAKKR